MKRLLLAAFGLCLLSGAAAAAGDFTSGAWNGRAYFRDGQFSHCAMSARYRSGVLMLFSITRSYNLNMGFAEDSWDLPLGRNFQVTYRVDRMATVSAPGRVLNSKQFVIDLPDRHRIFDQFRRGHRLYMEIPGKTFTMSLAGTGKALNRLLACTKAYAV